ncbi:DUF4153 domain-containing protein [Rudanella paleaurantiibacter]|uniref:DUF4153 domain-containing protein n=1 Tax=Rudanella paleaurantiibacter TaxID=2614655 RepID=A0A7J5TTB6_9BACT|nr:DUF4153 domain-containing protein [Rudanella paleaurantiibacter]KAB7726883.1 DUF4153 domain-containing protein [Rudanella paleaurantiibacter]
MRDEIILNQNNPRQLERLYRENRPSFKVAFNELYPQLANNPLTEGWYQRLNFEGEDTTWGTPAERLFVIIAALLAGTLAKFPDLFSLDEEFFYTRNIGFIVFPALTAYFAWKKGVSAKVIAMVAGIFLLSLIYINYLPQNKVSDTLVLACIHLPFWLWSILGFTFGEGRPTDWQSRLGFLQYNGNLVVMTALLVISGVLVTAITINLFRLIGVNIEEVYFGYVVVFGASALPLVATFFTQTQPAIVNKVSPLIANLFSPVVLVMLVVYLVATLFSGKDPYHDREFLLLFNALLVGVMALIFFSVTGSHTENKNATQVLILFLLSAVTILVNGVVLSAVLFRISEWGITPNRAAVLGANLLMLIHLFIVAFHLFRALTRKSDVSLVGRSIALFLPVYSLWSAVVVFIFPVLFGFK